MIPVAHVNLGSTVRCTSCTPGQPGAVWRKYWQNVRALGVGDSHRRVSPFRINQEQLEISMAKHIA